MCLQVFLLVITVSKIVNSCHCRDDACMVGLREIPHFSGSFDVAKSLAKNAHAYFSLFSEKIILILRSGCDYTCTSGRKLI